MSRRESTLEDVAARAGVSRATASRVINGSPRVTEATRDAVERAVEALRYTPNRAARSLAGSSSDTVALVVSEPSSRLFADPFFAGTVRGVAAALAESRYQLVLLSTQSDADRGRVEHHLLRGTTDGVLLLSTRADDPLPARLAREGLPCVVAGRPADAAVGYVDADNEGGARAAVAHLLERGRRVIATVAGPAEMAVGVDRYEGWRAALADAGLKPARSLVARADFTRAGGRAAAEKLLDRTADLDAVFAASDLMALGVLDTLRAAKRKVPRDVAVVGFDDSELAESADPPLTSVRQPIEQMGHELAARLLAQLEGAEPAGVVLPTELVIRQSS
ncbi:MAG TPA: LacI family DNA-binding transcriptional regulator [Acidimicrobiales bacterium]|nr:LacI family DNA-binding transcriptional regulator [Acidimicrobiales bacterium]